MRVTERLYLTEDQSQVVSETDRRGRHLFAKKGTEIPDELARKYGLLPSKPVKGAIVPPEIKRQSDGQIKGGQK